MYYGEHGVVGFVGDGGESACTTSKTSTSFKRVFKTFKRKELLRERGGAVFLRAEVGGGVRCPDGFGLESHNEE